VRPSHKALSAAATIEEIVRVTSEYLASWSHEDLERLPDGCRPAWVKSRHDIEFWADRLACESGKASTATIHLDDERKLDRMTSHFLIASVRLRQLGFAPA
jgi:hypothetical protein